MIVLKQKALNWSEIKLFDPSTVQIITEFLILHIAVSQGAPKKGTKIPVYCMASSMSGQDEPNRMLW